MEHQLNAPLIFRWSKAKSCNFDKNGSFQAPRRQSVRVRHQSLIQSQEQYVSVASKSESLQWEKSNVIQLDIAEAVQQPKKKKKRKGHQLAWFGISQVQKKKYRLNDMFFNLRPKVQKVLYITNYVLNAIIRVMFINLLVFLGILNRWAYLEVFLSLYLTAIIMYFNVMVKLLFTKSDKASIYCQKIFNQVEWSDIQTQRLMGTHFSFRKIVEKVVVFFNPFTKFEKSIKISFLRQELFKRIELVMVFIPFSFTFFIKETEFISEGRPNFNLYITGAICLQSVRATITYLCVYLYS